MELEKTELELVEDPPELERLVDKELKAVELETIELELLDVDVALLVETNEERRLLDVLIEFVALEAEVVLDVEATVVLEDVLPIEIVALEELVVEVTIVLEDVLPSEVVALEAEVVVDVEVTVVLENVLPIVLEDALPIVLEDVLPVEVELEAPARPSAELVGVDVGAVLDNANEEVLEVVVDVATPDKLEDKLDVKAIEVIVVELELGILVDDPVVPVVLGLDVEVIVMALELDILVMVDKLNDPVVLRLGAGVDVSVVTDAPLDSTTELVVADKDGDVIDELIGTVVLLKAGDEFTLLERVDTE